MTIAVKNTDGTLTLKANPTFVDNLLDGLKAPLLADNEYLDADSAFWASVSYALIGSVAGGYFGRRRAEAGKPAIAGLLY